MIITDEFIKSFNSCEGGYEYWVSVKKPDLAEFMIQAHKDGHSDWANWLFVRSVSRVNCLKYVIFAAKLALPRFEKSHPDVKIIQGCIDAASLVLLDDTPCNREIARQACASAYAAVDAADAAAYAAVDAAYAAGYASVRAAAKAARAAATVDADTTGKAARAAVDAAVDADYAEDAGYASAHTRKKTWGRILKFGITLLKESKS